MSQKAQSPSIERFNLKDNPSNADLKKAKSPAQRLVERFQASN